MKFDKEFKRAISELPSSEKDKLILRLLKKDLTLANRLSFELVDERNVDEVREDVEDFIKRMADRATNNFYSPGYLMMDMRDISGHINDHVRITKDKFGEASLNLIMLIEVLKRTNEEIQRFTLLQAHKLCTYIIARAFKILLLVDKLDDEYFIEFRDDLRALGILIAENDHLMRTAIFNGFDVNWLIKGEIPEDIVDIHKELRANGYLR